MLIRRFNLKLALQPAIDAFTLSLTQQFNKLPPRQSYLTRAFGRTPKDEGDAGVQPLIYGTYQAYLTRYAPPSSTRERV